mgnify:CR=1 FL=1
MLSQGRLLFGIGIGWLEEEFQAKGMNFQDRAPRGREWVKILKALWTQETPQYAGSFHSFEPIGFHPKPIPHPIPNPPPPQPGTGSITHTGGHQQTSRGIPAPADPA